jgi:hypothetical protein
MESLKEIKNLLKIKYDKKAAPKSAFLKKIYV